MYTIKHNEITKDNVKDRTMWGSKNFCRITVSKYFKKHTQTYFSRVLKGVSHIFVCNIYLQGK